MPEARALEDVSGSHTSTSPASSLHTTNLEVATGVRGDAFVRLLWESCGNAAGSRLFSAAAARLPQQSDI
jgi:hypothetical protein